MTQTSAHQPSRQQPSRQQPSVQQPSLQQPSPYGPAQVLPEPTRPRPPLVVPVSPRRGWELADGPRRFAALAALPVAAVVVALALGAGVGATGPVQALWLGLGPVLFYSLARVLRPEPRDLERTSRHLLASAATSWSVPVVAVLLLADGGSGSGDDLVISLGSLAFLLGVLTAVWGVIALGVRWFRTPPAAAAPGTANRPS